MAEDLYRFDGLAFLIIVLVLGVVAWLLARAGRAMYRAAKARLFPRPPVDPDLIPLRPIELRRTR